MTDLVAWLRAAIDADVQRIAPGPEPGDWCDRADAENAEHAWNDHVERVHRKARVLRQVAAMRAIVDACEYTLDYEDYGWPLARDVLRHLATIYADRDGYQPEWAPE